MSMIQKLHSALRAFWLSWKGQDEKMDPVQARTKSPEYALAVEDLANMMNDVSLNAVIIDATQKAKEQQDKQIDEYFKLVLGRAIGKDVLELYFQDQTRIPTANTSVEIFTDFKNGLAGRRIRIFFQNRLIGDAKFMTQYQNGKMRLVVEKLIP